MNKIYHVYVLMGTLYRAGYNDRDIAAKLGTKSYLCFNKARDCYKKASNYNQSEGSYEMAQTSMLGSEEYDKWCAIAKKQGYKEGMKSWTSDIKEFNK